MEITTPVRISSSPTSLEVGAKISQDAENVYDPLIKDQTTHEHRQHNAHDNKDIGQPHTVNPSTQYSRPLTRHHARPKIHT